MMRAIETTGKTVDEAVQAALSSLKLERKDVDIEVISEGSKGLFGLFGAKVAKVKVTAKEEIKAQLEAKKDKLVVSPLSIQSNKYIYLADVQHSEKYWTNLILKRYYNVKSIVRSCDFEKSSLPNEFLLFAKIGQTCSTEVKK